MTDRPSLDAQKIDFAALDAMFSTPDVAIGMRGISETGHRVASDYWRVPMVGKHLSPRMKEILLFAMHVSAASLNVHAIQRQVGRVQAAGGTLKDILDVLITIANLPNHALYAAVPVLEEEWAAAGHPAPQSGPMDPVADQIKARFIEIRGFWNDARDPLAHQMPEYFAALSAISTESWLNGPLTRKEREFICIGIDCTITHTYLPGLRIHIRNAILAGAKREEILEIFQLAALMGMEGYVLTAEALFGVDRERQPSP